MTATSPKTRVGTAQRQRGKERVKKILDAARNQFLSEGYSGLRLRKVAQEADISLGHLTYYFGSKADLFQSLIDDILAGYGERNADIALKFATDPKQRIDQYLSFLFRDCNNPKTQKFFYQLWATASHDSFVAKARDATYTAFENQVCDICLQANPGLKGADLQARAMLIIALVEGLHVLLGGAKKSTATLTALETKFKQQCQHIIFKK